MKKAQHEIKKYCPAGRKAWRQWLQKNHEKESAVWLVYYKKHSGKKTITYNEAVDEALCFGWIDSKAMPLDEERYMQYFTRRKPNSVWSKINKAKVAQLISDGLMTEAGMKLIDIAKQNGSWTILDEVEELVIPADLKKAFGRKKIAFEYFNNLSRTDRRNILQWLVLAKRPETRQRRIEEVVTLAQQRQKPKQFST